MAFMSGRALFNFNPDLFVDDEGAVVDDDFNDFDENPNEDDEEEKKGSDEDEDEGPLYGNDNDYEESKEESR